MLLFTGCESKQEPCQFNKKTIDLVVNQKDWAFDNDTHQFYCHFDIEELTANVYNYGEVSVSREYNSGTKDAYQVALPMSLYMVEEVDDGQGGTSYIYYTQHIDYRVGIGYVEVQLTNSDYAYADEKPESMIFRLQLTY
ncbi:MAG: hypothetical protein IKP93_04480 [Paludibacteraceae bacterium]|nr:hypothetical protein [Paludibacteraceae bacterium]